MASVSELFENMPRSFKADKAGDLNATVVFDLSGDQGGQWAVNVANGAVNVNKGPAANPTATVKMAAADYADMVSGKLNPINAFMMGKVKVEGDLNTVMKFQSLFGM
jgi:putative sterol carrier protein